MHNYILQIISYIKTLEKKKLIIFMAVISVIFSFIILSIFIVFKPNNELLYSGLERDDVVQIGLALQEAGINFDVSPDGTSLYVRYGMTAQARMALAEKALPQSNKIGYELYDKLGTLGLTSFMQEVTKVRALEGELSRSILMMKGIRAARVHLVIPDSSNLLKPKIPSTASVIIKADKIDESKTAKAIQHLLSTSIPNLSIDKISVLDVTGRILSNKNEQDDASNKKFEIDKQISNTYEDSVRKILDAYLTRDNYQISVQVSVNTDKKQINETIYNPDSKVERSTHFVKETHNNQNQQNDNAISVEKNIANDKKSNDLKQNIESSTKQDEINNFELSSRLINIISEGYVVEKLSIAIIINKNSPLFLNDNEAVIDKKIQDITDLASAAVGLNKERGDSIKAVGVIFNTDISPLNEQTIWPHIIYSIINISIYPAMFIILISVIIRWLVRPSLQFLVKNGYLLSSESQIKSTDQNINLISDNSNMLVNNQTFDNRQAYKSKLNNLIKSNEELTIDIMRHWLKN